MLYTFFRMPYCALEIFVHVLRLEFCRKAAWGVFLFHVRCCASFQSSATAALTCQHVYSTAAVTVLSYWSSLSLFYVSIFLSLSL